MASRIRALAALVQNAVLEREKAVALREKNEAPRERDQALEEMKKALRQRDEALEEEKKALREKEEALSRVSEDVGKAQSDVQGLRGSMSRQHKGFRDVSTCSPSGVLFALRNKGQTRPSETKIHLSL